MGVILEAVPARCPAAVLLLVEYEGPMTVVLGARFFLLISRPPLLLNSMVRSGLQGRSPTTAKSLDKSTWHP